MRSPPAAGTTARPWRCTNGANIITDSRFCTASASVTAAGVTVGGGVSAGWGTGYSLQVGTGAFFSGNLPALPDDPNTPEDEWSQHRYSINPYVYLHSYETENGGEAYYYVQNFIVEH